MTAEDSEPAGSHQDAHHSATADGKAESDVGGLGCVAVTCGVPIIGALGGLGTAILVVLLAVFGVCVFSQKHRELLVANARVPASIAKHMRLWLIFACCWVAATIDKNFDGAAILSAVESLIGGN